MQMQQLMRWGRAGALAAAAGPCGTVAAGHWWARAGSLPLAIWLRALGMVWPARGRTSGSPIGRAALGVGLGVGAKCEAKL
jgi:hypothetical protein